MCKNKRAKLFYDFEFSGLHQNTTPISVGVVANTGEEFYGEFTDYDRSQVDDWVEENVIKYLLLSDNDTLYQKVGNITFVKGAQHEVAEKFTEWLTQFGYVEFWGDCSWYDGILLNELLGGAHNLPENVNYIFFDIATLFKLHGIDPDISREAFIDRPVEGNKHNALYDARVIQESYDKLYRNRDKYKIML